MGSMRNYCLLVTLALVACGDDDDDTTVDGSVGFDSSVSVFDAGGADAPLLDATPAVDAAVIDAMPVIDAAPTVDAAPETFYWADWTAATADTASGTFTTPAGVVTIAFSGELVGAQTDGGTNFWIPGAPYVNGVTANSPDSADIVRLVGSAAPMTITFDPPVTGLVMAVVSLGAPNATIKYDFDTGITLLSFGAGYWGNGTMAVEGADTITGNEGHGAIQFAGTISSLTWTVIGSENWHGFTLGIPNQ
jgi:hypothetical protein